VAGFLQWTLLALYPVAQAAAIADETSRSAQHHHSQACNCQQRLFLMDADTYRLLCEPDFLSVLLVLPSKSFIRMVPMKKHTFIINALILLIVVVMVGAAEILQENEIIFPEITAIAVGALMAPKLAWRTNRTRILLLIMVCAVLGVGIVRFLPAALWIKISVAYAVSEVIFLCSGTSFAPMISAIVLPVLLGTESPVYLIAALLLTLLILVCHVLLEKTGIKEAPAFVPSRASRQDWIDALVRLALVAPIAFIVLRMDARFVIAPPLLVAFTEFSRRESGARKRPITVVAAITLCAMAGAACRWLIHLKLALPLTLAALVAAVLMIAVLSALKAYVPPAGALCILPMLIPAERVALYPLQIFAGACLAMGLSLWVFRSKTQKTPA